MMTALSPTERRALKARAHSLKPVVFLGGKGLTDGVCAEVERALAAHELIKVRVLDMNRDARDVAMSELCARCNAHPVQHIGRILVIYRERPPQETNVAPLTRGERRESRSASRRPASARPPRRPRSSR